MGAKHGKKKSRIPIHSILVIGNAHTGKTALIKRYEYIIKTNKESDEKNNLDIREIINTIGNDYTLVDHTIKGEQNEDINIKVKIWDSVGSERFSYTPVQIINLLININKYMKLYIKIYKKYSSHP